MLTMLVINIPPELEDGLVDYLLETASVDGFTSYEVRGHGKHKKMSIAEQVSGRRKRLQFEVIMEEENVAALISDFAKNIGNDIIYWQQGITNKGEVK